MNIIESIQTYVCNAITCIIPSSLNNPSNSSSNNLQTNLLAEDVENRNPVEDHQAKEIDVGDSMKLLEEIAREEVVPRVLGCADIIGAQMMT